MDNRSWRECGHGTHLFVLATVIALAIISAIAIGVIAAAAIVPAPRAMIVIADDHRLSGFTLEPGALVTDPLTVEPSFSEILNTPLVNDITVPAVRSPPTWLSLPKRLR